MCFRKKVKIITEQSPLPDWFIHTRDEVAEIELYAASIHYTWMVAIEEGRMTEVEIAIGGDYPHHYKYWQTHQEAAWLCSPEYCKKIGFEGR